jgi:TPR repeat protein
MQWLRKAAENGIADACMRLATRMYADQPYAREVGHVMEAGGDATSAAVVEGHNVPPDVLTSVVHWLRKGCATRQHDPIDALNALRKAASEGGQYCQNEGCEVVGQLKDFKVCPQCKTTRYCGAACQKQHWNAGGHKETCGTSADRGKHSVASCF